MHLYMLKGLAYGLGSRGDHICLVWKDECYSVQVGWSRISGAFGVTFGSGNIAIQILLPDDAPVKNNTYRDTILDRNGNHQQVRVEDFADLVRCQRPAWLVNYIEREARKNTSHLDVRKRLQTFLDELKAPKGSRCGVEGQGDELGETAQRSRRGKGQSSDDPFVINDAPRQTKPAKGKRLPAQLPGVPAVTFSEDPAILEEMSGRAAMYKREENAVLLNPRHFKYKDDLEKIYEDVGPAAERRSLAKRYFDEEYCFNAGKFVILGWLFKGRDHWEDQAWQEALGMGAFSIYLAEPTSLDGARRRLRQKLNSRKMGHG
jgi:hypothetical protein